MKQKYSTKQVMVMGVREREGGLADHHDIQRDTMATA